MGKVIEIKECKGANYIDIDKLKNFQGNLKELTEDNYKKLRGQILKYGFRMPVFIWRDNILDGHQRIFVIRKLMEEGYKLSGKIPTVELFAENEKDAKRMILAINFTAGKVTADGLYEFTETNGLNFENDVYKSLDFAGFDMEAFSVGYYKDIDFKRGMEPGSDEFSNIIDKFEGVGKAGKTEKNENWFYIEFYKDDKKFKELMEVLAPYMLGKSKHELSGKYFYELIKKFGGKVNDKKG